MTSKIPFLLYGSEVISEIEDKRPNVTTKDAPIALIFSENSEHFGNL